MLKHKDDVKLYSENNVTYAHERYEGATEFYYIATYIPTGNLVMRTIFGTTKEQGRALLSYWNTKQPETWQYTERMGMTEFNSKHPELRPGEIFLGNSSAKETPEHFKNLKTYRFGEKAYDIYGLPLDEKNPMPYLGDRLRPTFVHVSEEKAHDDIMTERIKKI